MWHQTFILIIPSNMFCDDSTEKETVGCHNGKNFKHENRFTYILLSLYHNTIWMKLQSPFPTISDESKLNTVVLGFSTYESPLSWPNVFLNIFNGTPLQWCNLVDRCHRQGHIYDNNTRLLLLFVLSIQRLIYLYQPGVMFRPNNVSLSCNFCSKCNFAISPKILGKIKEFILVFRINRMISRRYWLGYDEKCPYLSEILLYILKMILLEGEIIASG